MFDIALLLPRHAKRRVGQHVVEAALLDLLVAGMSTLGLASRMMRNSARLSSDSTAATVAIDGNQTVGASLPLVATSDSPGRRIPTTQRFISGDLIGLA
ncbi:MAG: hypothetical protein ACYC3N_04825 [Halothiobacillus sp.]